MNVVFVLMGFMLSIVLILFTIALTVIGVKLIYWLIENEVKDWD